MRESEVEPVITEVTHPPGWLRRFVAGFDDARWERWSDDCLGRAVLAHEFGLVSMWIEGAALLPADAFRAMTAGAYRLLGSTLVDLGFPHPLRIWNVIPGILDACGELPHRYMVFNAGRIDGYRTWLGAAALRRRAVPTATGVGHGGGSLLIHCLAGTVAGRPVENPRQVPSSCYSRRYGPLPPCFARATMLPAHGGRPGLLLVGGTASVVGEHTRHIADLDLQTRESFVNLATLSKAAAPRQYAHADGLDGYRSLRIYFVHEKHRARLEWMVGRVVPAGVEVEWIRADLCRRELLVEIEGIVELVEVEGHSGRARLDPQDGAGPPGTDLRSQA